MLKNQSMPIPSPLPTNDRIAAIDGLRGLAIILVVLYHTYSRWESFLPWVVTQPEFWVFKYGFLGVQLFFLISGYVIYLTLEKCNSLREFLVRRWLRLFPAMLLGSLWVYASGIWFTDRPNGTSHLLDLIPGFLFIESRWINLVMQGHVQLKAIEGAFWSLFVEVKFYVVFGVLYFLFKRRALQCLIGIFLLAFLNEVLVKHVPAYTFRAQNSILYDLLSLKYFGWFCVGAMLYKAKRSNNLHWVFWSVVLMIPTVMIKYGRAEDMALACAMVYGVFCLVLFQPSVSRILASRLPVFIGFISYPLYLIHENAMVAMTVKTYEAWPDLPGWLSPWPGLLTIAVVAYALARWGEPMVRSIFIPTRWSQVASQTRHIRPGSRPSPH